MHDKDLIEIKISRVIPAPKWRVMRLLTRVWEFPKFVPSVKEVTVLQRRHHAMTTNWRVQVDSVPIKWTEEDTLALERNAIYFKATEGDLQEFGGEWKFQSHPEGTEVTVSAHLKVGIPAIGEFSDPYVKKLVTQNFAAILEMLEERLISMRYQSYRHGDIQKLACFGIIGHLYNFTHLEKSFTMLNPSAKLPSREFLGQLFSLTPSFKLYDIVDFESKTGQKTKGCFIIATFIPDMIEKDIWAIFSKVVKACKIAEKHGVGIVTLGGFTSIVAERIGQEISREVDVPITTGNTFTAAMTIDGILKAAGLLNMDINRAKITIVGGTGDIGSACARVLVDKVKNLTITGRTKSNLKRLNKELSKRHKAKVIATTENEPAIRDADIVIAAASATSAIINIDWFKPGSIICDVGYPKNISYTPTARQDILIFSGGLTKPPVPIPLPIDIGLPNQSILYGCFAEAIILALERRYENFSFGRGNITVEKVDQIKELGKKHGFEVADFYWGDRLIDETVITKIKEAKKETSVA